MNATLTAQEIQDCRNESAKISRSVYENNRRATIVKTYTSPRKFHVGIQFLTDAQRSWYAIKNDDGSTTFPVEIL